MIGYYNIHAFLCACSNLIYIDIYRVYDVKANRNRKKNLDKVNDVGRIRQLTVVFSQEICQSFILLTDISGG